jgi:hypothetical protein
MSAEVVFIQLPGGPYLLDITEAPDGTRQFGASEMCICPAEGDAPHWHEVAADAPSLTDLFAELLTRYLQGAPS